MVNAARPWLHRLDALSVPIREAACEAEAARRLPASLHASLVEAGLYRLWVPRSLGGAELDLPASLEVFEAVSALDGAVGWNVTIGVGGGLFAPHLEPAVAENAFRRVDALVAGSGAPTGEAHRVAGGYRVSGRWRWCSGAHQATLLTASCVVREGDDAAPGPHGPPLRAVAMRPDQVRIEETWDSVGLRGTGSHDIVADDVFVPADHTFDPLGVPWSDGPLYRYPFLAIARISFAGVALGIARHGLACFEDRARSHTVEPEVARRLGLARATWASARAWLTERTASSWERVVSGEALTARERAEIHLAATHATAASARAMDSLRDVSGMGVLDAGDPLGRCWRDVHAVRQHVLVGSRGYAEAGAAWLDEGAASP